MYEIRNVRKFEKKYENMEENKLKRNDLYYPELSYKVNGILFEVYKALGGSHQEKYYQKAVAVGLKDKSVEFKEQVYVPLNFKGQIVGKYFLDFLIENKIVLELKRGKFVPAKIISQVEQYLDSLKLPLALIACFTQDGVVIKRIINHNYKN